MTGTELTFGANVTRHSTGADLRQAVQQAEAVGAWSEVTTGIAARHAEIISLTGMTQVRGKPPGTFDLSGVPEVERRLARLRGLLASERPSQARPPVLDCLLQVVRIGVDPQVSAAALVEEFGAGYTVESVLESPFLLLAATAEDAVAELLRRRNRWGISSWCTHAASVSALAEVVAAYRAHSSKECSGAGKVPSRTSSA